MLAVLARKIQEWYVWSYQLSR